MKTFEYWLRIVENSSTGMLDKVKSMTKIGNGSTSSVYSDGEFAYKVIDVFNLPSNYSKYIGLNLQHVVNIYDVIIEDEEAIIKMELLDPINTSNLDKEEYERINQELCEMHDDVTQIQYLIPEVKNQEIIKMLKAFIFGCKELEKDTFDLGFHNLMFNKNKNDYKLVDII